MAPARVMGKNVRPKRVYEQDAESEEEVLDGAESGSDDEEDDAEDGDSDDEDGSVLEGGGDILSGSSEDEGNVEEQMNHVSFAALKQAQDALSRKRKRGPEETTDQDAKLEALRKRLRQIKEAKAATATTTGEKTPARTAAGADEDEQDDSDSDSAPEEIGRGHARTSKHAPTAQSSRHQVTRKRTVVDVPKLHVRDPRFDALHQGSSSAHAGGNSEKAYSFLTDYQRDEIAELKSALKDPKKPPTDEERELLRRKINSMENRLKTQAAKEREQEVLRQHRREEKGKVLAGKTPFYLKQKDLKERALVEKFKGMKGREREKVVEKRRRKESQREMKALPRDRRGGG